MNDPEHDEGLVEDMGLRHEPTRRRRRRRGRGGCGCLVALAVLVLLAGAGYVGLTKGVDWVSDKFASAEDYPGPGTGSVLVEVKKGDSATEIGRALEQKDVVASVEAFIDVANARTDEAQGIQVGFYEMQQKMSASGALDVLVDPENLVRAQVTIPEGLRVVDILDILGKQTDFKRAQYAKALENPAALGLPPYAEGNPEGYLFPATYEIKPTDTPASILKRMVDRWRRAAEEAGLEEAAQRLGYTPHELMTIASLIEAEGRGDDMPKIARVIYNRLENPGAAGTTGTLQIDATVNYALGRKGVVAVTEEEIRTTDSPYNTYQVSGLPPGPIEAPGMAAIEAATHPADGDWYYYVTVNLRTGETKFAESYDEFLRYKNEYRQYCETSDEC